MYLISGTIFFVASLFLFVINHFFSIEYSVQGNANVLLCGVLSFLAGILMYIIQYQEEKKK